MTSVALTFQPLTPNPTGTICKSHAIMLTSLIGSLVMVRKEIIYRHKTDNTKAFILSLV